MYAEMKQTLTEAPYVTAPPPMGYSVMMKEDSPQTVQPPHQSQSKGSGGGWYFLKIFFTHNHIIYTFISTMNLVTLFLLQFRILKNCFAFSLQFVCNFGLLRFGLCLLENSPILHSFLVSLFCFFLFSL